MNEVNAILAQLGGFDPLTLIKGIIFYAMGFVGMVVAYSSRWARDRVPVSLWNYLTGDRYEVGMALTKLAVGCWVAGTMDYLGPMTLNDLVTAGILLGMAIPNKVDNERAKEKENRRNAKQDSNYPERIEPTTPSPRITDNPPT